MKTKFKLIKWDISMKKRKVINIIILILLLVLAMILLQTSLQNIQTKNLDQNKI